MSRKYYIFTMGCQMNVYDSDRLSRSLARLGFVPSGSPEGADLVLLNTCTVRAKPEQKAFSILGRMGRLKQKNPGLILGMTGCLAQQQGRRILERFPQVDLVLGPRETGRIGDAVTRVEEGRERVVATSLDPAPTGLPDGERVSQDRISAYLSIMEGCNNYCTYCIVPYVRGVEVSRDPEDLLREAGQLVSSSTREITLLGQNVNAYRWERDGGMDFPGLLRKMDRVEGLLRLRFTTSHPKNLSPDLIGCFGELERLCPHIHLPVQAGADSVLKGMGRGYTRDHYMGLAARLREVNPELAITSDVMVGFPGETERDFEDTLDLIRRVRFDGLFSFKYSDRKGTVAEKMDGKVGETEKGRRLKVLQGLQKQITLEKHRALVGRSVPVLVEGPGKRKGQLSGRTATNKIVNFYSKNSIKGQLVNVLIEDGLYHSLRGVRTR